MIQQVMKFGGSCLRTAADVETIARHLTGAGTHGVAVLSARNGVTEALLAAGQAALLGRVDATALHNAHRELLAEADDPARRAAEALLAELDRTLQGIAYLGELSPRSRDRLLSLGERLSVVSVAGLLRRAGLVMHDHAEDFLGINTDDRHGDARILPLSAPQLRSALAAEGHHLAPGFIGRTAAGAITTLGRGGSDYTAAYVAAVLRCPLWLYKDVPGFQSADPKQVPAARLLSRLNYLDALELAHYGSKVIHDKALHAALEAGVPIEIRGFADGRAGTSIGIYSDPVLAVSALRDAAVINLTGEPGPQFQRLAALLGRCADVGLYPLLLTEASPRGEISIVVQRAQADEMLEWMRQARPGEFPHERLDGLGVVSIIGSAMRGRIGFAAEVFGRLAQAGVNIRAIAQTPSERNVTVIVRHDDVDGAARALHAAFVEGQAACAS